MWGSWLLPPAILSNIGSFFHQDRYITPMIAFCGGRDSTFYPIMQNVYFDSITQFHYKTKIINLKKDSFCLPFASKYELFPKISGRDLIGYGSAKITSLLNSAGYPTEFYFDCDAKHGFETDCDTCAFLANYGTQDSTEDSMEVYFAERSISFFQSIINGSASGLHDVKFTECENYRVTCNSADSNHNCRNTDTCPNSFDDGGDDGGVWGFTSNQFPQKNKVYENFFGTRNVFAGQHIRKSTARHS